MAKAHGTEHQRPVLPAGSPARSLVSDTVWAPPFAAAGPTARRTEVPAVLGEAKIGVQKNTILNPGTTGWHPRDDQSLAAIKNHWTSVFWQCAARRAELPARARRWPAVGRRRAQ